MTTDSICPLIIIFQFVSTPRLASLTKFNKPSVILLFCSLRALGRPNSFSLLKYSVCGQEPYGEHQIQWNECNCS